MHPERVSCDVGEWWVDIWMMQHMSYWLTAVLHQLSMPYRHSGGRALINDLVRPGYRLFVQLIEKKRQEYEIQ